MGILLSWKPKGWLDWPCEKIGFFSDLGICECYGTDDDVSCYKDQIIYRTESSVMMLFVFLLILCVSGCARHAARDCPIGKFIVFVTLFVVMLFIPNAMLSVFGSAACAASSVYLVAQTILVVDFGYTWNEYWMAKSHEARRNLERTIGDLSLWQIGLVAASLVLCIIAIIAAVILCISFPTGAARALVIGSFLAALALALVSIFFAEHGALLVSALVMAYTMWLSYEALSMMPPSDSFTPHLLPQWISLLICALSLVAFALCASFGGQGKPAARDLQMSGQALAEQGAAVDESDDDVVPGLDTWDFSVQCMVHAAAAVYIAASLAPARSNFTLTTRSIAVVVSLLLYGWTLIAPKVLTNRSFD
jgi:hypothetical protein